MVWGFFCHLSFKKKKILPLNKGFPFLNPVLEIHIIFSKNYLQHFLWILNNLNLSCYHKKYKTML